MPREFGRNLRVADAIQRIAAPSLAALARENALGMVTLTAVEVAPDMTVARLRVSLMGHPDPREVMEVLRARLPEIRSQVAHDLPLKKVPALQVVEDRSIAQGARISELLKESRGNERRGKP